MGTQLLSQTREGHLSDSVRDMVVIDLIREPINCRIRFYYYNCWEEI